MGHRTRGNSERMAQQNNSNSYMGQQNSSSMRQDSQYSPAFSTISPFTSSQAQSQFDVSAMKKRYLDPVADIPDMWDSQEKTQASSSHSGSIIPLTVHDYEPKHGSAGGK